MSTRKDQKQKQIESLLQESSSGHTAYSLLIHTGFSHAELALASNGRILDVREMVTRDLSAHLLTSLEELIACHTLGLSDLSFIGAHLGPAPYTSLRVSLATINGLAFASGIRLVGVHGLEAFLKEYTGSECPVVVLLNAFSREVYYGVYDPVTQSTTIGIAPYHACLKRLKGLYSGPVLFVGNGTKMYKDTIETIFGRDAHIPDDCPDLVSMKTISDMSYAKWKTGATEPELFPVYMKPAVAQ